MIEHPSAHRINVKTFPASGAEPIIINLRLPPKAEKKLTKKYVTYEAATNYCSKNLWRNRSDQMSNTICFQERIAIKEL